MGLLDEMMVTRQCQRGHGAMDRQPGLWVLQQVSRPTGIIASQAGALTLTGKLLTMHVFVCSQCGEMSMVDERVTYAS